MVINLTPVQEAQLSIAAKQTGLNPPEFIEHLIETYLSAVPLATKEDIDIDRLLFTQWKEEDVHISPEETAENNRIYAEIEKNGISRIQL